MIIFNLGSDDWISVGKGLLIALAGASAAYIAMWVSSTDFGLWTPVVVAALSVLTNYLRKISFKPSTKDLIDDQTSHN